MKADSDIKRDVDAELKWNPQIDETDIATKINGGVVTLCGFARSFYEKHQAEVTVKRVAGVVAVANDLEVKPAPGWGVSDPDIARDAVYALKGQLPVSWEDIKLSVQDGRIFLDGTVEWNYQRERAEDAMRGLKGVWGVRNHIKVQPRIKPDDIRSLIEKAFRRSAEVDAKTITVEADGDEVTLRGEVRSWAERDQAQASAWRAPGVSKVVNEIVVKP